MKLWLDVKSNEYQGELISMALVAEDGREWYGIRYCGAPGWWVREHVMPYLIQSPELDEDLRKSLNIFLRSFDSIHIISDWPGDIAHFCNFLEWAPGERIGPDDMTFEVIRGLSDTVTISRIPNNALEDARALAYAIPDGWVITTTSHYHVNGVKMLFVAMKKDGVYISEEGVEDISLWARLREKATTEKRK